MVEEKPVDYLALLKTLYTKQKLAETSDLGLCIALSKTLSKDLDSLQIIKNLIKYIFYIDPKHYFYLLYFSIPKKQYFKFVKTNKLEKEKQGDYELVIESVKQYLGCSNKEFRYALKHIENQLKENKKEWKDILGIENEKKTKKTIKTLSLNK